MASSSPSPSPSGCSPPSSSSSKPPSSTSSLKSLPKNAYWDASKNSEPACPSPVVSFHYKLILSLPRLLTKNTTTIKSAISNVDIHMLYIGKPQGATESFLLTHLVARIGTTTNPKKKQVFHFLAFPLLSFFPIFLSAFLLLGYTHTHQKLHMLTWTVTCFTLENHIGQQITSSSVTWLQELGQ